MVETEETDSKRGKPAKKGLHGWRAALAVFGCGTLAAFGVFGVIVGVLSLFVSTVSSGVGTAASGDRAPVPQTGEPVADLEPGELNICEQDVQYSHDQSEADYVSENFHDPAVDGITEDRTITDQCSWKISPLISGLTEPWDFDYSYEAVVSVSEGGTPIDVASRRFDEIVETAPGNVGHVLDSGESDLAERAHYFYGRGSDGEYVYSLIGQTRSTVYVVHFESAEVNGEVGETRFKNEARAVVSKAEYALNIMVPD